MKNVLRTDIGLLIFRVSLAALMLVHGFAKMKKLFGSEKIVFPDPIGWGAATSLTGAWLAEFICPILIILGIRTRLFSIPVVFTMFVAAFVFHANDPFVKKELAIVYMLGFILLALIGGGKIGFDKYIKRR